MDRRTHQRFLTYRETWEYFREPGEPRLDVETWKRLDAELQELAADEAKGELEAASVMRLRKLRRLLRAD